MKTALEANELRIGNLILMRKEILGEEFLSEYEIASINCDETIRFKSEDTTHENYSGGTIGCYSLKRIIPIPLTEEWLVKFGFDKGVDDYMGSAFVFSCKGIRIYDHGNNKHFSLYSYNDTKVYVDSVHSLQNLYFALTGKELTIL